MRAFAAVLKAEDAQREAEIQLRDETARLKSAVIHSENAAAEAWRAVEALMAETGEVEVTLPGVANDYKVYWSAAGESVKVCDIESVPEAFVKTERKPKLKDIGDHLKQLRDSGQPLPNWASLEKGKPSLAWKPVKPSAP